MSNPFTLAVVGAQWGDEGKAKVVDTLAQQADMVVRSQGGCNAGHTVCHGDRTYKFHHVPSGILYPQVTCVMGNGMVIAPDRLQSELDGLAGQGIDLSRLRISTRAHVTLPLHTQQDQAQETAATATTKIGTTGRGIGPTYMDKVGRFGIRVADLLDEEATLSDRLTQLLQVKSLPLSLLPELLTTCRHYRQIVAPYAADTVELLHDGLTLGQRVLFEGAQGALLDIDHGTYPYVTSSNATTGGACTGSGLGPSRLGASLGVMKAYLTRVGEGPFPTELLDEQGALLATRGHEVGTTTGRARRVGWFDGVLARYATDINGLDGLALTKVDVLDTLAEIPVCIGYRDTRTDALLRYPPVSVGQWQRLVPVYQVLPGWQADTSGCRSWSQLPEACQQYLTYLSQLAGCPIWLVGTGPDRTQTFSTETAHPVWSAFWPG